MILWTWEHFITMVPTAVVMIILSLILRKVLIHKRREARMIPLQVIAVILVALEIGKQIVSISRGYDLYHLLFHFCSIIVFVVPAMAFYRGKHQQAVSAIASAWITAVFLLTSIYPVLIYSADNIRNFFHSYLDFHTVAFHNLVIFAFFLLIALDLYTPLAKTETRKVLLFTVVFCVISAVMAQLLETNFNNFYSCNIPPLENLRISMQGILGYWITQILYIFIVTVLDILFVQMSYWLIRGVSRLVQRKNANCTANP